MAIVVWVTNAANFDNKTTPVQHNISIIHNAWA